MDEEPTLVARPGSLYILVIGIRTQIVCSDIVVVAILVRQAFNRCGLSVPA